MELFVCALSKWATQWVKKFWTYANNKGADKPAHLQRLITAFVVRCLDSIIPLVAIPKISRLANVCSRAGWFESYLVPDSQRQNFLWHVSNAISKSHREKKQKSKFCLLSTFHGNLFFFCLDLDFWLQSLQIHTQKWQNSEDWKWRLAKLNISIGIEICVVKTHLLQEHYLLHKETHTKNIFNHEIYKILRLLQKYVTGKSLYFRWEGFDSWAM